MSPDQDATPPKSLSPPPSGPRPTGDAPRDSDTECEAHAGRLDEPVAPGGLSESISVALENGLLTAPQAARAISAALRRDDELWAFKMVLQARDHLRYIVEAMPEAAGAFVAPPPSTGSTEWDTFLAAVVGHEFEVHHRPAPAWTEQHALTVEWVLQSARWDERGVRLRTPVWLAARGIFVDENDLTTA